VSEFLSGGTLYMLLHETTMPLSECQRLEYAQQLLEGVRYMHKFGAHLDLKSDQLLLDEAKRVLKITDFGLSKVRSAGSGTVGTASTTGNARWSAPEKLDEDAIATSKADVYSVAMIM